MDVRDDKKNQGRPCRIRVAMIRHGQTPGNRNGRYIGTTDEALFENAKKELQERDYPVTELLFVSPLLRCRQTAELIYPHKEQHVIERVAEIDFGEFEGKSYRELNGNSDYQAWIDSNGMLPFPGGESREQFIARSLEGFFEMLRMAQERRAESVAAVVHGGTIMAVLSSLCGGEYFDYQVKNGEGFAFVAESDGEHLVLTDVRRL